MSLQQLVSDGIHLNPNLNKMKIGIYAGSFNPFHKGHYNILLKAEKIFDRVIIARGINPEKEASSFTLPKILDEKNIINYEGLLTEYMKTLPYDKITVIRGLRNTSDFQYELIQYRFLKDLMPDIQLINIFCDAEYEHISSSAIKTLMKYDVNKVNEYLLENLDISK